MVFWLFIGFCVRFFITLSGWCIYFQIGINITLLVIGEISTKKEERKKKTITTNMVKTFQAYLPSTNRTYSCVHCRAHLASHDELISKSFQGSQGPAYLFNSVVNVACGQTEERVLLTGLHAVADIYCECCKTPLGWKYEHAFESSQKYKEGKYIIELAHMIKENGWD